jgi:Mrp family chromosome partitioning ATPase
MKLAHLPAEKHPVEQVNQPVLASTPSPKPAPKPILRREGAPRKQGETSDAIRVAAKLAAALATPEQVVLFSGLSDQGESAAAAAQVASGLARLDRGPVLLVDASLHEASLVDGSPGPGLCELLLGEVELPEVLPLVDTGLSVLSAGRPSSQALSLLSIGFTTLLQCLRKQYRWIIVSGPPFLSAEGSCLAQQVDGTVIVVASGKHRREELVEVKRESDSLKGKLLGIIISDSQVQPQPRRKMTMPHLQSLDLLLLMATLILASAIAYLWKGGVSPRRGPDATHTTQPTAPPTNVSGISAMAAIVHATAQSLPDTPRKPRRAITLQVAATTQEREALALAQTLQQDHLPAFVRPVASSPYYRVLVGPYPDASQASRVRQELRRLGFEIFVRQ